MDRTVGARQTPTVGGRARSIATTGTYSKSSPFLSFGKNLNFRTYLLAVAVLVQVQIQPCPNDQVTYGLTY
jgi:hypothetical protein